MRNTWKFERSIYCVEASETDSKIREASVRTQNNHLGFKLTQVSVPVGYSMTTTVLVTTPKAAKDVSRFLGMTEWYPRFTPRYANIAEQLYRLKRKRTKVICTDEA